MKEHSLIVNRTARYYTLGELTPTTKQVWFVLHGFGMSAKSFLKMFEPLANEEIFFVAPEALNRYYASGHSGKVAATWMTKEDRLNEINDYVQYLHRLYHSFQLEKFSQIKITALGFSQGASTLTRWVNAAACHIDNCIVYAGEVAPELLPLTQDSGLQHSSNFFICGDADEIFTPAVLQQLKANYHDLRFTEIDFKGKHEINTEVLYAFLQ